MATGAQTPWPEQPKLRTDMTFEKQDATRARSGATLCFQLFFSSKEFQQPVKRSGPCCATLRPQGSLRGTHQAPMRKQDMC